MKCSNCGKVIKDEDATYCPYCSKPVKELPIRKTRFPIAGGILAIVASCVIVFNVPFYMFAFGIFGIIVFVFGLIGGILTLRRQHFTLAIVGICVMLVGDAVILQIIGRYGGYWLFGLIFALPVFVLALLSLIFTAISKGEFS